VSLIPKYKIGDFGNRACFVECSVNVEDRDRLCKLAGGDVVFPDKVCIDEEAGCTAVNESLARTPDQGVRGLHLDLQLESVFTRLRSDDQSLRDALSFPRSTSFGWWSDGGILGVRRILRRGNRCWRVAMWALLTLRRVWGDFDLCLGGRGIIQYILYL
jgi:hypothetical protein